MKYNNKATDLSQVFSRLRENIVMNSDAWEEPYIPDIIEFCNSSKYIGLTDSGINLFPMQKIIFKTFYRGQRGNENISLTQDELQLLQDNKQDGPGGVIDKYYTNEIFNELVLVLGRRAGKDFMVSLMALYESMKLLEIPGGCPYKYYGLAPGNPIYIMTIATAADQAHILFEEIRTKLQKCYYFRNKVGCIESDRIWLLTPEDRKINKDLVERGLNPNKGSICIMSGHSNSDALLGKSYYTLLFDEVASFKSAGNIQSGERTYTALEPGKAAFSKPLYYENGVLTISPKDRENAIPALDENGEQLRQLDAKTISISSPRSEEGIFYKIYRDSPTIPNRLAFRLPTWKVNLGVTESVARKLSKNSNETQFRMEFGAEFAGTAGEKFIPSSYIDDALLIGTELGLDQKIQGRPGIMYYAHLDPATTSHNYALIVLHMEERVHVKIKENGMRVKERMRMFVVDHIKIWQPLMGTALNIYEIDKYIIDLAKRFRFAMVTYDQYTSIASMQKLRNKGIPSKITPYRKQYKMKIYDQLEHILVNHQLALPKKGPHANLLEMELKCLKRIYSPVGFKIKPDPDGEVQTDDAADALAGAIGSAMESNYKGYVRSSNVNMPLSKESGNTWNIGSGSYNTSDWRFIKRFYDNR